MKNMHAKKMHSVKEKDAKITDISTIEKFSSNAR